MFDDHCSTSPSQYFLFSVSPVDEEPSGPVTAVGPLVVALTAATAASQTPPTPPAWSQETTAAATRLQLGPAAATVPPAGDRLSPGASDGVRTRTETLLTATLPVSMATRTTIPTRPVEMLGSAVKFWDLHGRATRWQQDLSIGRVYPAVFCLATSTSRSPSHTKRRLVE